MIASNFACGDTQLMSASWPGLSEWEGFLTQLLVLTIASQMQVPIWSQEDCHLHLAKANLCKLSPELGAWITNRDSPIALKFKAQFQLYSQEVWGSFLCLRSHCKYLMTEEGWELCTHSCPLSLWSMTCSDAASEPVTSHQHTLVLGLRWLNIPCGPNSFSTAPPKNSAL